MGGRSPPPPRPLPAASRGWSSIVMARLGAYRPARVSLFMDIGQGAGLAGSSGVRPFLPPLLAGALARGDIGLDFSGTSYAFLESPWWLVLLFALAVASYLIERRRPELATSRQT